MHPDLYCPAEERNKTERETDPEESEAETEGHTGTHTHRDSDKAQDKPPAATAARAEPQTTRHCAARAQRPDNGWRSPLFLLALRRVFLLCAYLPSRALESLDALSATVTGTDKIAPIFISLDDT